VTKSSSPVPELESTRKPAAIIETATLVSLGIAVLSLFLFAWIAESISHEQTKNFDLTVRMLLDLSLKHAFHRTRPTAFFGALPHSYSFPSGHALFSFCFYGVLAGLSAGRTRSQPARILIWTLAAVLVTAIGLSRIYLGVHYPSDVIAGYLAATLWVTALISLDRMRIRRRSLKQTA